ncbi:DUF1893 domain-containing protein [Anaerotignum sp.]|uniref:DUF1893 domain-containing protein n=1 Tax=Anaerotignum sp. TaxID=2039241 RepID=UPI0033329CFE
MVTLQMEQAKAALAEDQVTFAVVSAQGEIRTSTRKGITPIMELLKVEPKFLEGASVADKVIGKAAALLLIKGKINNLYAHIISSHGVEVLKKYGIPFQYDKMVPFIINRAKDGMCPMEATVLEEVDAEIAFIQLQDKLVQLAGRNENAGV